MKIMAEINDLYGKNYYFVHQSTLLIINRHDGQQQSNFNDYISTVRRNNQNSKYSEKQINRPYVEKKIHCVDLYNKNKKLTRNKAFKNIAILQAFNLVA